VPCSSARPVVTACISSSGFMFQEFEASSFKLVHSFKQSV